MLNNMYVYTARLEDLYTVHCIVDMHVQFLFVQAYDNATSTTIGHTV